MPSKSKTATGVVTFLAASTIKKIFEKYFELIKQRQTRAIYRLAKQVILTEAKDDKNKVLATAKINQTLSQEQKDAMIQAVNDNRQDITYESVAQQLNNTGFFNEFLTDEGMEYRNQYRGEELPQPAPDEIPQPQEDEQEPDVENDVKTARNKLQSSIKDKKKKKTKPELPPPPAPAIDDSSDDEYYGDNVVQFKKKISDYVSNKRRFQQLYEEAKKRHVLYENKRDDANALVRDIVDTSIRDGILVTDEKTLERIRNSYLTFQRDSDQITQGDYIRSYKKPVDENEFIKPIIQQKRQETESMIKGMLSKAIGSAVDQSEATAAHKKRTARKKIKFKTKPDAQQTILSEQGGTSISTASFPSFPSVERPVPTKEVIDDQKQKAKEKRVAKREATIRLNEHRVQQRQDFEEGKIPDILKPYLKQREQIKQQLQRVKRKEIKDLEKVIELYDGSEQEYEQQLAELSVDAIIEKGKKSQPLLGINEQNRNAILNSIPSQYRALRPTLQSVLEGKELDMNQMADALTLMGLMYVGFPAILAPVIPLVRDSFGIDFNEMYARNRLPPLDPDMPPLEPGTPERQRDENKHSRSTGNTEHVATIPDRRQNDVVFNDMLPGESLISRALTRPARVSEYARMVMSSLPARVSEYARTVPTITPVDEKKFEDSMEDLTSGSDYATAVTSQTDDGPETLRERLSRVPRDLLGSVVRFISSNYGIPISVLVTAITSGAMYSQSGRDVREGIARGAIGGAVVGGIAETTGVGRAIAELLGLNIEDPADRAKLASLMSTATAGVTGAGLKQAFKQDTATTNAIEEEKIDVEVLQKQVDTTQQKDEQKTGKLRPRFIIPSVDVLDVSQQEKYIDDVEFSLFDYVPENSEGGNGGLDNMLVRDNAINESVRFQGAGVTLDSRLLYNKDITSKMSDSELEVLFLGHKLPALQFVDQNPELVFDQQATQFDVNNQLTDVEMFSPYSNFSNTDVYWNSFNKNVLYSKVP